VEGRDKIGKTEKLRGEGRDRRRRREKVGERKRGEEGGKAMEVE